MPVFPFFAGLAVGVAALRLYKNERLRAEIRSAGQKLRQNGALAEGKLRQAAISGLDTLAGSSARLRDRLEVASRPAAKKKAPVKTATVARAPEKPRARRQKADGNVA
ncbi:MAG: hypothetical protein LBQ81_12015 [Zoogloeaceae bacterium]|nr:hypothetical protein [Zoogloeaceae bacterium]